MPAQNPIRLILVDDHQLRLADLSVKLAAVGTLQLIGQASNNDDALQLCRIITPEVVLINLDAADLDGIAVIQEIKLRWPGLTILVVSESENEPKLRAALQAGAAGYLPHDGDPLLLASTIQHVVEARHGVYEEPAPVIYKSPPRQESISPATRRTTELVDAARIQASLLPASAPQLKGWDLAVKMLPARETSGDFFDFLLLENGRLAIVIADVSDKGLGAALFMAMSSTLFRTYLVRHPSLPALTMSTINDRILSDTGGSSFVTAFVGVLEPDTGRLRYVNAGHVPPLLISTQKSKAVEHLSRTGIALGVLPDESWKQKIVKLIPGDLLLFYTDGIVEAQNSRGDFYGEARLRDAIRAHNGAPAQQVVDAILADVARFSGDAPRHDDMVVIALVRRE